MGDIETYLRLRNSGIALVEHAPGTPDELRALGADASDATELAGLHQACCGDPLNPSCSTSPRYAL
ncbi:hypothetical protein [Corynebacterium aurimucosum]|uniref:hypothetical protein n=1 Tax=Corynebacterium aurimucosum TaxID=169292 RepID=UPI00375756AE